ncbi:MAG: D-alanine--D-alanine ligase family protein [Patescibacteria group bacterium]|nr:D-alanine--D-alanine ligase [Patescibacteria group bacterium]
MNKIKIGIIFGGRSGEHEVSLVSAGNVINALDKDRYEPHLIGITKDGEWIFGEDSLAALKEGRAESQGEDIIANLRELDVVFPVLHGPYGEDGTIQGLFEIAGVPYVGCGVLASSVAMDKAMTKSVWDQAGLKQVKALGLMRKDWEKDRDQSIYKLVSEINFPIFVKPANMGSSVGVSKAQDNKSLAEAIDLAFRFDRKIVVEEGLDIKEIEVAVLGNDDPEAAEPGEVLVAGDFYDFNDKYVDGKSSARIPAEIPEDKLAEAKELSIKAFKAVDGAGMARVDLFYQEETGDFYLNEINTIPGFTEISMYPKMWDCSGLPYSKLIDRLVELALERHKDKGRNEANFSSGSDWFKG